MSYHLNTPQVITKNLQINTVGDRRKVRISSNFLEMMGFAPGRRLNTIPSLNGGFSVQPSETGNLQVYKRRYSNRPRSNNPHEAVVEFADQNLIRSTFPAGAERFHVQIRQGNLRITPTPPRVFNIGKRYLGHDPLRALVAMTGGVDVHCLASAGIKTDVVLEWRPDEARDIAAGRTLQETNALNVLRNGSPRILLNEDIYNCDPVMLRRLIDEGDPVVIGHYSIQCDDASVAKSASLKARSIENGSETLSMIYPVLRQIETLELPVVIVENVPQFKDSHAGVILRSMLRRWGYHVTDMTFNARDHGSIQNRKRYYMVASIFPGFREPETVPRNDAPIWPLIEEHLSDCRDITDSYAVRSREVTPKRCSAYITRESTYCPTIIKSQDRLLKDGVMIEDGGRVYKPSEKLLKALMQIPDTFSCEKMAIETASECLGQSIDYLMHHRLMESVKEHVLENLGPKAILRTRTKTGQLF